MDSKDSKDLARAVVAELARKYETTGNPIHAWEAWRHARHHGIPVPEAVLTYLDGCAQALAEIRWSEDRPTKGGGVTLGPPKDPGPRILRAFGLSKRGPGGIFQVDAEDDELTLGLEIMNKHRAGVPLKSGRVVKYPKFPSAVAFAVAPHGQERTYQRAYREFLRMGLEPLPGVLGAIAKKTT